jgi:fermentation-respiration switch protein FrsA (DUF1100 family)
LPILTLILILLVILILAAGFYLATRLVLPRRHSVEETYRIEVENGNLDVAEYDAWPKREMVIQSPQGYPLFGIYFPAQDSKKTLLLAHGFTYGLYGSVKYMPMFRRRGFNILIMDLRHHGRSGGTNITFGLYEKQDMRAWMTWALAQLGPGGIVGTMGESLGAAVALQHAAIDPRPAFVIADCPYSDLERLVTYHLKKHYHLPPVPLLYVGEFWCRLLSGMTFENASPLPVMEKVASPLLLIHGEDDNYVPAQMSRELFEAKTNGIRELYIVPSAGHAQALTSNPEEYERQVSEFLAECGI